MQLRQQKRFVRVALVEPPIAAIPSGRHQRSGQPAGIQRHVVHPEFIAERARVVNGRVAHKVRTRDGQQRIARCLVGHEIAKVEGYIDQRVAVADPVRVQLHVQLDVVDGAIQLAAEVQQLRTIANAARQIAINLRAGGGHRTLDALQTELWQNGCGEEEAVCCRELCE